MIASKVEVGKKYLTKKGLPVTVLGPQGNQVIVRLETTGNKIAVEKEYELLPYEENKLSKEARLALRATGTPQNGVSKKRSREGSLAAIIDPLLFAGENTIKEIAVELTKKAAAAVKGKDLEANIRARLFSFRRKGCRVEKDAQKRIRVIAKKG